jgi:hypothetical protein
MEVNRKLIVYLLPLFLTRYSIIISDQRIVYGPHFPQSDPQNTLQQYGMANSSRNNPSTENSECVQESANQKFLSTNLAV